MAQTATSLPRLETGDRLSREEFHRRYELRPDIHKAELIDGVVHVPSPAKSNHSRPHARAAKWLFANLDADDDIDGADNGTFRLANSQDEVQPDLALWRVSSGKVWYDDDGYPNGAPELVFEIAHTSTSYDLGAKKQAYERAGVLEYIVWDTSRRQLYWFRLQDRVYLRVEPNVNGDIESAPFAGLVLNVPRLLASIGPRE